MKHIVVIYSGAKHSGGIETYLEQLFANIDKEKLDLRLLSLGNWPLTNQLPATSYQLQILSGKRVRPKTVSEIKKYVLENNIDLIVSQGTVANAYARAASFLSGVPSLVVVHSDLKYDYPRSLVRSIYVLIDRVTRFQTKYYIAVSSYLKEKLVDSGIPSDKVTVIYNGVVDNVIPVNAGIYLDPRDPTPHSCGRASKHEDDKVLVIGSIGRLHPVKNYAELILALPKLQTTNYQLLIYGEGSERSKLETLISQLKLEGKVKLFGNIEQAREQLSQLDIYVQPSLSEGFGITVVEAMLAGKPVIVSPFGSLPELVQNDKTGIVMKSANYAEIAAAINDLALNKEKRDRIALAGQKYAQEKFGVDRWIRETETVFEKAAK